MTKQQHPLTEMTDSKPTPNDRQIRSSEITPPRELVEQWIYEDGDEIMTSSRWYHIVCTKAAQWGADQELDACCEWLYTQGYWVTALDALRAARRPKPKTQEEEVLEALDHLNEAAQSQMDTTEAVDIIRSALERLQEMEEKQ